jgi:peptide/nickel transport system substrate-binding protein
LSFNPTGPIFAGTGKLNPFAVPEAREAMHWLMDREYIAQEIYGGMAAARWTPFNNASGDYAALADVVRPLEAKYAYNKDKATEAITSVMEDLGATLVAGKWQYDGAPVEIILLIRTEDERRGIGDYVGNQLEDIGFTVVRDYKTAAEASPIWMSGDPNDGQYHVYTGGWVTTAVPRDLGSNFAYFYTDMGRPDPMWQNYVNDPEFYDLAERLDNNDFATVEERRELMARALELAMADNVRMFLVDRASVSPRRAEVVGAADLYGGMAGSWLWPMTLRREGQVGGSVRIAMPSILTEPWNPIAGSNWIYDMALIRATGEMAYVPDPYTGLYYPRRLERNEVVIQEGLPVGKTLDWVELSFAPEITVPEDAWVDWNAAEQRFLTVGEVYTETQTALRKNTVHYPADLFDTVKWHDGSPLSIGDFVMGMILTFDRAKEESPIFDASAVASLRSFMSAFKGVRIVSEDPLVIETYSDLYYLDAEWNISNWWPYYNQGQGSWHALTLGIMADAAGEAVFSSAKEKALEVDRISYIAGATVGILKAKLDEAVATGYLPYEATLGQYITPEEAAARYANLTEWFRKRGHLWIGTGPWYLERAFPVEGTVILQRNADYPDSAYRWLGFSEPMLSDIDIDGPDRVTIGSEAAYDLYLTFKGEPYLMDDILNVKYLLFDATGELAYVGEATAVEDGLWQATLTADVTGKLAAGSNRLEVVAVSKRVAVPSFDSITFVTSQ